jgi:8-oxo-dGTP pyrophosphatase MutT (NUDIX family)
MQLWRFIQSALVRLQFRLVRRGLYPADRVACVKSQVGALPYRIEAGELVFLLVTSRRTGRWIFPKGSLIPGLDAPGSAAREAWEEAGVEGIVEPTPLGAYLASGRTPDAPPVRVEIYPLHVQQTHDDWQEKAQRQRQWVNLADARVLLSNRELADLSDKLHRKLTSSVSA